MPKYSCPECNKSFKNRSSKSLCMRRHSNKDLVFQCPHCPRIYKDPSSLRKHKRLYEHNKEFKEADPKPSNNNNNSSHITNSDPLIFPMNLSLNVDQSHHIPENLVEILPKNTLPSIDTFAFSHSAIDCRVNNSKDSQQNFTFPERALDLTSTFRPKVFINSTTTLPYAPSYAAVDDSLQQYQYPINLTIQPQNGGYYAYDSQLPIDLSYHQSFWNNGAAAGSSHPINFTSLLNGGGGGGNSAGAGGGMCPLDLTLDQSYASAQYGSSHIGWIC